MKLGILKFLSLSRSPSHRHSTNTLTRTLFPSPARLPYSRRQEQTSTLKSPVAAQTHSTAPLPPKRPNQTRTRTGCNPLTHNMKPPAATPQRPSQNLNLRGSPTTFLGNVITLPSTTIQCKNKNKKIHRFFFSKNPKKPNPHKTKNSHEIPSPHLHSQPSQEPHRHCAPHQRKSHVTKPRTNPLTSYLRDLHCELVSARPKNWRISRVKCKMALPAWTPTNDFDQLRIGKSRTAKSTTTAGG